jgi:hypothetical protein
MKLTTNSDHNGKQILPTGFAGVEGWRTNRPSAVDTESSQWPTKCSSKLQQPQGPESTGLDRHQPTGLRQRRSMPPASR